MTVKEALISFIGMPVQDGNIEMVLVNHDLSGSGTYTKTLSESIEKAAIDVLYNAWLTPDVTEGGYAIKYDRTALRSRLLLLAQKHSRTDILSDLKPKITGKSVW